MFSFRNGAQLHDVIMYGFELGELKGLPGLLTCDFDGVEFTFIYFSLG